MQVLGREYWLTKKIKELCQCILPDEEALKQLEEQDEKN
jgi:hypothetical protein